MHNTLMQVYEFLGALYGGILIGISYSTLKLPRIFTKDRIIGIVLDIIFVIIASAIAIFTFYIVTGGEIRMFLFFGLLMGFVIEKCSIDFLIFHFVFILFSNKLPK
ncbi:MAG: spore cortex biosynthesis protein YabQ [Clostridia bacterium]